MRYSKVDNLESSSNENEVGRLEIRMDDSSIVADLDAFEHLPERNVNENREANNQTSKYKEEGVAMQKVRDDRKETHLQPEQPNEVHVQPLSLLLLQEP